MEYISLLITVKYSRKLHLTTLVCCLLKPVAKIGGLTPSLPKPPNAIGRPNPILPAAPKKAYLSSKEVKKGNEKAKCASGKQTITDCFLSSTILYIYIYFFLVL